MPQPNPFQKDGDLMYGQELDDVYGFITPFTERHIRNQKYQGTALSEINPNNLRQSLIKTIDLPTSALGTYFAYADTYHPLRPSLPDRLLAVSIYWNSNTGDGTSTSDPSFITGGGNIEVKTVASSSASAAITGDLWTDILPGLDQAVLAESCTFFLPIGSVTLANILSILSTQLGSTVVARPVVRPVGYTVIAFGNSMSVRATVEGFESSGTGIIGSISGILSRSAERQIGVNSTTFRIPPSLHGAIAISQVNSNSATASASASYPGGTVVESANALGTLNTAIIPATSPTVFPIGHYLWEVDTQPYKPGWIKINTISLKILSSYV